MSNSIELAKKYYDIIPSLEVNSVYEVFNIGLGSSMRKAYKPDCLTWSIAHDLEILTEAAKQMISDIDYGEVNSVNLRAALQTIKEK